MLTYQQYHFSGCSNLEKSNLSLEEFALVSSSSQQHQGTTLRAPDIKSNQSSGQCNALQDDQEASIDLRHGIVV